VRRGAAVVVALCLAFGVAFVDAFG